MSSPFSDLSALSIKIPSGNPKLPYLPTSTQSAISSYSALSTPPPHTESPSDQNGSSFACGSPTDPFDCMSPSASYTINPFQFTTPTPSKSLTKAEITCNTPNTINTIIQRKRHTRHKRASRTKSSNPSPLTPHIALSSTPLTPTPVQDITFNFDTIDVSEEDTKEQKTFQSPVTNKTLHVLMESDDIPTTDIDSVENVESTENEEKSGEMVNEDALSEVRVLTDKGYLKVASITDTLQGTVFTAMDSKCIGNGAENTDEAIVVVKRTSKVLHEKGITIQNGKEYSVNENVLKEYEVLRHFTTRYNCPTQITKTLDFFESADNYYLVMENAGEDFFDFIVKAHKLINDEKLKIKEWRKFVKYMFYQMVVVVDWLHNQQHCCHLDISLENITVQNATFIQQDGYFTINPNIKIKFIDFGLAEFFDPSEQFQCVKYCGKTAYKAPEIYRSKQFDARKADVWSLGVVLFCMAVGSPPYVKPSSKDDAYRYFIKTGHIEKLLFQWNRHFCVTVKMLDLLKHMLRVDIESRYLMDNVIIHPWLSVYHKQYKANIVNQMARSKKYDQQIFDEVSMYKLPNDTCSI